MEMARKRHSTGHPLPQLLLLLLYERDSRIHFHLDAARYQFTLSYGQQRQLGLHWKLCLGGSPMPNDDAVKHLPQLTDSWQQRHDRVDGDS